MKDQRIDMRDGKKCIGPAWYLPVRRFQEVVSPRSMAVEMVPKLMLLFFTTSENPKTAFSLRAISSLDLDLHESIRGNFPALSAHESPRFHGCFPNRYR